MKDQLQIIENFIDRRNDWNYGRLSGIPNYSEQIVLPVEEKLSVETIEIANSYQIIVMEHDKSRNNITYLIKSIT